MNEPIRANVHDRLLALHLEEALGRSTPPDRTQDILRRCGAGRAHRVPLARERRRRIALAAILLLGLGVLVGVSVARPADPATGHRVAAQPEPLARPVPAPHPKGTDPADLRAMRSSEAMLAAEQKLAARIAAGAVAGVTERTPFERLGGWTYSNGIEGAPPEVLQLDGTTVLLTGFMLPIDEVEDIREFLLVPSLWSCCYGTPPDVNSIVRCVMPEGVSTDYSFEPLMVVGTLTVSPTFEDGYCVDIYQLHVDTVDVIQ